MGDRVLDGKSAVVTGAGSGVGRATALRFAAEGARVVVADLRRDWADETVRQIGAAGGTAVAVECDVSQDEQVARVIAAAVDNFGRLDILFNNVGIPTPRLGMAFEEHDVDDFDRLVAVNLRGVFLGCKYAVIRFKEQGGGGVILNTGSIAGLVGWGGTVYGATKGGVHQLTRAVAVECAPFGIRVNAICPGVVETSLGVPAADRQGYLESVRRFADRIPLRRIGQPEDVAAAVAFLASDEARHITGADWLIDGGQTLQSWANAPAALAFPWHLRNSPA